MGASSVLMFAVSVYLSEIVPGGHGATRHPLFIFKNFAKRK